MKLKTLTLLIALLFAISGYSQVGVSLIAGFGPGHSYSTNEIAVKQALFGGEYAFGAQQKHHSFLGGLELDIPVDDNFFVHTGLRYMNESSTYTLSEIASYNESGYTPMSFDQTSHRLSAPVGMGARMGRFVVQSGIELNSMIKQENEMSEVEGYENTASSFFAGWYLGANIEFGQFGAGVRYSQDFANVASGTSIGGQDLGLYGNEKRILVVLTYRLNGR